MRMKVSNYISQNLWEFGITQVFTVTGGGAMYLNDALGHQEGLNCLYNHHEQGVCHRAGVSYEVRAASRLYVLRQARTNAITGVVGDVAGLHTHART